MLKSLLSAIADWISLSWSSFRRLLGVVRSDRGLLTFALALLAVDLFWILYFGIGKTLHYLDRVSSFYYHKELLITTDGGVPELFNYAQTLLLVVLLVRLVRLSRQWIYVALALIFLVVLMDDALEIHEYVGRKLVPMLELRPVDGLRARDVGEVITWAALGALVAPLLLFGLFRADRGNRGNGLAFLLPFGLLLVCAIGVDQLYGGFSDAFFGAGILLDSIEDGGEMIAISVACVLATGAVREQQEQDREGSDRLG